MRLRILNRKSGRRFLVLLCFALMITVAQVPGAGRAESREEGVSMNVWIPVPEGVTAAMEGSEYYLYTENEGSIPYVMLRTYRSDDGTEFLKAFTEYMRQQYADLTVTADIGRKMIGDRECFETDFQYKVSGYDVKDRRIVLIEDGTAYLFTSKEVESLGLTVGNLLEETVASCVFLSEEDARRESGLEGGYLYCREDGMPLYWLDFTGIAADQPLLHCCASTGDPETWDRCLVLDFSTADMTREGIVIHRILDPEGKDLSGSFRSMTLQIYLDGILMISELEETETADNEEAWLPSGSFAMTPVRVAGSKAERESHLRPAADGPYQAEELSAWARLYAFRATGTYYPKSEAVKKADETYDIYLYEADDGKTTARDEAFLRYTTDAYGEGTDRKTEAAVSLMR